MAIDVDIQVNSGKVIITVTGQSRSNAAANLGNNQVVAQGNVVGATKKLQGGDGENEGPGPGSGPGSGGLVIGPIVIDTAAFNCSSAQGNPNEANVGEHPNQGNAGRGGDGENAGPGPGSGGPGSGTIVIGPIVIGGRAVAANTSAGVAGPPPPSIAVEGPPPPEKS